MTLLGDIEPLLDPLSAGSSGAGVGVTAVEDGGQPNPDSPSPDPYAANTGEALGFRITLMDDLIVDVADGVSDEALAAALEAVGGSILEGAGQGVQYIAYMIV